MECTWVRDTEVWIQNPSPGGSPFVLAEQVTTTYSGPTKPAGGGWVGGCVPQDAVLTPLVWLFVGLLLVIVVTAVVVQLRRERRGDLPQDQEVEIESLDDSRREGL